MADIIVIGGINIDIEGCPRKTLVPSDSNPGDIAISYGGVGRNIVENAARLGADVGMISLTGDDFLGNNARDHLAGLGVDVSGIVHVNGCNTGMYLSILNHENDMAVAICNMDILERVTPAFLEDKLHQLTESEIVGVDCNLDFATLDYITNSLHAPLFLDPVSASKAERVKPIIGRFHTIKPNRIEAELLSDIKIVDDASLRQVGSWFCRQGVKRVFISLGEDGVYYRDESGEGIVGTSPVKLVSATGAGDAFSAAILVGHIKDFSAEDTAKLGVACASLALEVKSAVNPRICWDEAIRRMK
ncbi:carbohydrate kinase family protein [Emergencia sp.]|uniref:carbohydrate kinase family protein n=1 Tax=Emergencia sp. TaxID=1926557 RepID=UPI003AF035C2